MIFVPFGSSPPPHSLVTKSTGTSLEHIISEGQYIAAQAAGKAPKFTPWVNNPLPIARFGDSIVVPSGGIPPSRWEAVSKLILVYSQGSCTWVPPRERHPGAPCASPDICIPGRCTSAAKSALMPNPSRARVPLPASRELSPSISARAGWGMSSPWASGVGREKVGLGDIPPRALRTSGQSPDASPGPARTPSQGFSSRSRERQPAAGSGAPGAKWKEVAGPGPPRVASYGSRPAQEGCGRADVGGAAPMGRRQEPGRAAGPDGAASCQRGIPGAGSRSSPMCP